MEEKVRWMVGYGVNESHITDFIEWDGGVLFPTLKTAKQGYEELELVHPFTIKRLYRLGNKPNEPSTIVLEEKK